MLVTGAMTPMKRPTSFMHMIRQELGASLLGTRNIRIFIEY